MDTSAIWELEDEKLLAAARRLIERNRGRVAAPVGGEQEIVAEPTCPINGGN